MEEEQTVLNAIEEAFEGVPRGSMSIQAAQAYDSYKEASGPQDAELDWRNVPDNVIENCPFALPHLDLDGWLFYIPAYMRWTLKHFRITSKITVDNTIYALCLGKNPDVQSTQRIHFRMLSPAQCAAVSGFLRFMSSQELYVDATAAKEAVDEYWGRISDA